MNATTLDINLSQTLANKTLVVTTILVSGPCGAAVNEGVFPEQCPAQSWSGGGMPQLGKCSGAVIHAPNNPGLGHGVTVLNHRQGRGGADLLLQPAQPGLQQPAVHCTAERTSWLPGECHEHSTRPRRQGALRSVWPMEGPVSHGQEWPFYHTCQVC